MLVRTRHVHSGRRIVGQATSMVIARKRPGKRLTLEECLALPEEKPTLEVLEEARPLHGSAGTGDAREGRR